MLASEADSRLKKTDVTILIEYKLQTILESKSYCMCKTYNVKYCKTFHSYCKICLRKLSGTLQLPSITKT